MTASATVLLVIHPTFDQASYSLGALTAMLEVPDPRAPTLWPTEKRPTNQ